MLQIFSVYDKKAQSFNTPFFCKNIELARRSFVDLCRDDRTVIACNPEDFDLWYLGLFSEETGNLVLQSEDSQSRSIMTGIEARVAAHKAERLQSELLAVSDDSVKN